MPIDNDIYNRMPDAWWDENGFLNILQTGLNRARFGYFQELMVGRLGIDPVGKRVLDLGCGGGLLAEEFARLGCCVVGIDPAVPSLATARDHAGLTGLEIDYCSGVGEGLPFTDETFDIVYCCDTLEHVRDLDRVISETARVLKKNGIYFYDTINRTIRSRLIAIGLLQEWRWSSQFPSGLHDWKMFIKPQELHEAMARHGLESRELVGLSPGAGPIELLRAILKRKRGEISFAELGRRMKMRASKDISMSYMGYGVRV